LPFTPFAFAKMVYVVFDNLSLNLKLFSIASSNGFRSTLNRDPTGTDLHLSVPQSGWSGFGGIWNRFPGYSIGWSQKAVGQCRFLIIAKPGLSAQLESRIREISVECKGYSGPTGILLCGCHTWGCNGEVVY